MGEVRKMPYYTKDLIEQARQMDLLTYLQSHDPGELVHISGNEYCTRTHDSLKISNGKWHWWSRGIGGASALDYLVKVKGVPFTEAVREILGDGSIATPAASKPVIEKQAKRLLLPKKCPTNYVVTAYLRSRGIDPCIIRDCIRAGLLYESLPYHNCIFVGRDESATARYASFRAAKKERIMGEAVGSDKHYSFRIEGNGIAVHLFESAIDLLSFATLRKMSGEPWSEESMVSLAGVYQPSPDPAKNKVPAALKSYLDAHPETAAVILHLDRDRAGMEASRGIMQALGENYMVWDEPPPAGKDMNDYLLMVERSRGMRARERKDYER